MSDWRPDSWQGREALQQPRYPDPQALERAVTALADLPPLVTSWEIETLKGQLAEAAAGRRFLLQGGDCAEVFDQIVMLRDLPPYSRDARPLDPRFVR